MMQPSAMFRTFCDYFRLDAGQASIWREALAAASHPWRSAGAAMSVTLTWSPRTGGRSSPWSCRSFARCRPPPVWLRCWRPWSKSSSDAAGGHGD